MTGEKFKRIIEAYGLRSVDLAKILDTTRQSVNALYKTTDIKSSLLEKVACHLNVNIGELYGYSDTQTPVTNNIYRNRVDGDNYGRMGSGTLIASPDMAALQEQLKVLQDQVKALQKTNQDLAQANAAMILKLTKDM